MSTLQVVWYFLVGGLFTGYAILDGFDLGTGWWYLTDRSARNRGLMLNAIGPVWDGNEVWLITAGGALFAAFPAVYASVFSGMYLALILVLFGLILRAVAIEFRGQADGPRWRFFWDLAFSFGSLLPALLFGVALGNVMAGLKLDVNGDYTGSFFALLNPFALYIGVYGLVMFIVHSGLFLLLKTEGEPAEKIKRQWPFWWRLNLLLLIGLGPMAAFHGYFLFDRFVNHPWFFPAPVLIMAALIVMWNAYQRENYRRAFLASAGQITALMLTVAIMMFPKLVRSTGLGEDLTAANSSSGPLTLKVMLIIALIGMPLVLFYTTWVYRTWSGKVIPGDGHY